MRRVMRIEDYTLKPFSIFVDKGSMKRLSRLAKNMRRQDKYCYCLNAINNIFNGSPDFNEHAIRDSYDFTLSEAIKNEPRHTHNRLEQVAKFCHADISEIYKLLGCHFNN